MTNDQQLIKLDQASRLLSEVNSVEQAKDIIDIAQAGEVYAKRVLKSEEAEMYARAIKLMAQRKAGCFLKEMPKVQGARPTGLPDGTPQLKDIGISKKQSSNWQKLAEIPEETFEQVKSGKKTIKKATQEIRRAKRINEAKVLADNTKLTDVSLLNIDFRNIELEDSSIDLILTDPPYPKEYLPLWQDLFNMASKKLKDGGFLVAYSGQMYLDKIMKMDSALDYYWTFCLKHKGASQIVNGRNVMCGWKPILIFQKGIKKLPYPPIDVVVSESREKDGHEWQQSESGAAQLIEIFSKPSDVVLDPFMGAGTFPYIAHKMKRKAIGAEIDNASYLISKARFND